MQYGYFDDEHREYVITRPDTPLPWMNYLGCESYFGLISNTAGGYSFYKDARLRRLTRYRYNNAPLDVGGRYIYLRDRTHGEAKNSWLTGTAAWNYVAITQWILGIRPTLEGLQIEPCLPKKWGGYSATRNFRGCKYDIEVMRVSSGPKIQLFVDGVAISGTILPLPGKSVTSMNIRVDIH